MEKTNIKNDGKMFNFLLNTEPFSNKRTHCDCPRVGQWNAVQLDLASSQVEPLINASWMLRGGCIVFLPSVTGRLLIGELCENVYHYSGFSKSEFLELKLSSRTLTWGMECQGQCRNRARVQLSSSGSWALHLPQPLCNLFPSGFVGKEKLVKQLWWSPGKI